MDFRQFYRKLNDQSDQQCKFLGAHTALCGVVEHWQLRAVVPKLGECCGCKISLSAMQTRIRQKRPYIRIPYFRPSKCRPLHSAAPLPAATANNRPISPRLRTWYVCLRASCCVHVSAGLWCLQCLACSAQFLTSSALLLKSNQQTTANIVYPTHAISRLATLCPVITVFGWLVGINVKYSTNTPRKQNNN